MNRISEIVTDLVKDGAISKREGQIIRSSVEFVNEFLRGKKKLTPEDYYWRFGAESVVGVWDLLKSQQVPSWAERAKELEQQGEAP